MSSILGVDKPIFGTPRTPPSADIFDNPLRCYTVNAEWDAFISGAVTLLTRDNTWDGDDDERNSAIQSVYEYLSGGICGMIKFRQNPSNPCQLQQTIDNGDSWTLAFDYSLCQSPTNIVNTINLWNESNVFNETQNTTYNGDITNIYSDWGYDATGRDDDRDTAICYACRRWVDMCCDTMINIINNDHAASLEQTDFFGDVSVALGQISLALAGVGIYPVAALTAGIGLLISGIALNGIAALYTADTTPYEDENAKELVACAMYLALVGATPTYTAWSNSLDYSVTGNEEKIRAATETFMQDETNFVNWLGLMVDVIEAASVGDVTNDCGACGWEQIFTFSSSDYGFTTYQNYSQSPKGLYGDPYSKGITAWYAERISSARRLSIDLWFDTTTITYLQANYTVENSRSSVLDIVQIGLGEDGNGQLVTYGMGASSTAATSGNKQLSASGLASCDRVMFYSSSSGSDVWLTSLTIRGIGDNPFI